MQRPLGEGKNGTFQTQIRDGAQVLTQPIGTGGYVRAELRGEPFADPDNPAAGRLDLEALTNPIFLVQGTEPAHNEPADAPPNSSE